MTKDSERPCENPLQSLKLSVPFVFVELNESSSAVYPIESDWPSGIAGYLQTVIVAQFS